MKKYPSKISYGLLAFILIVLVGTTIPVLSPPIWPAVIINFFTLAFVGHLYIATYYVVDGNVLIIRAGLVVHKKIDIGSIKKISESRSLMSAPALSLDRLEVWFDTYDSILISPKDKSGFIAHLIKINPQIIINQKSINHEKQT